MKIYSSHQEFDYSWEEVSTNNWRKYCSWNDRSEHVLGVDTLSRTLDPQTKILRTERLITCKQNVPVWLQTFIPASTSYVYEVSYIDPDAKKVTMCSQNMTSNELISIQETVVYSPGRTPGTTAFYQRAKIIALCGGWQKIKNTIEEFTVERFKQNAATGREGFERVLAISRQVFAEQREQRKREQQGLAA